MITDTYLYNITKLMNGESSAIPSYTAFTSTVITPDSTDTSSLFADEYTRVIATGVRSLNQLTFSSLRPGTIASSDGDILNTMGLFNASTGGELLAEAVIPSILHTTSFDLETDWTITVERNT